MLTEIKEVMNYWKTKAEKCKYCVRGYWCRYDLTDQGYCTFWLKTRWWWYFIRFVTNWRLEPCPLEPTNSAK